MHKGNLTAAIPATLPAELVECLASGGTTRIERIVSKGHKSAPGFWYDQERHEWVVLIKGEAVISFDEDFAHGQQSVRLLPGDYLHIAAHVRHRVDWTSETEDTIWLAVFY